MKTGKPMKNSKADKERKSGEKMRIFFNIFSADEERENRRRTGKPMKSKKSEKANEEWEI